MAIGTSPCPPFHKLYFGTSYIWDASALALFARMVAAGEPPTLDNKIVYNNAIIALKAANLFDTQFDVLVTPRARGTLSSKMNWIKNSSNGLPVPNGGTYTHTDLVGDHSDGVASYLRTRYTPPTDGVLYLQDNACWGYKVSGSTNAAAHGHGVITGIPLECIEWAQTAGVGTNRFNNGTGGVGAVLPVFGYNNLSRNLAASYLQYTNNISSAPVVIVSAPLINANEMYMLAINYTSLFNTAVTEILEEYHMGKFLSLADFIIFQGIMNTFFANLT
jgi:hypothetical protein